MCFEDSESEDLINGNFPDDLKSLFTEKRAGLFPSMAKIHFNCSCPDWADMCKHVAAVLYGIGSRFDRLIWNGSVNCCGKWVKENGAVRLFCVCILYGVLFFCKDNLL